MVMVFPRYSNLEEATGKMKFKCKSSIESRMEVVFLAINFDLIFDDENLFLVGNGVTLRRNLIWVMGLRPFV